MKIQKILTQSRRDFTAILVCEHCDKTETLDNGYDDDHYHQNVIPDMECKHCKKKSGEDYRPLTTKYSSNTIV